MQSSPCGHTTVSQQLVYLGRFISPFYKSFIMLGNNSFSSSHQSCTVWILHTPIIRPLMQGALQCGVWLKQAWLRLQVWLVTKPIPTIFLFLYFYCVLLVSILFSQFCTTLTNPTLLSFFGKCFLLLVHKLFFNRNLVNNLNLLYLHVNVQDS